MISQIQKPLLKALTLLSPENESSPPLLFLFSQNTAVDRCYSSVPFFDPKNVCLKVNPRSLYFSYYWTNPTSWLPGRYLLSLYLHTTYLPFIYIYFFFSVDLFPAASVSCEFPWKYPKVSFSIVQLIQAFLLLPLSNSPSGPTCSAPSPPELDACRRNLSQKWPETHVYLEDEMCAREER